MNPRSIPKIARWAGAAAIAMALAVAASLAYRGWRAARSARPLPAAVPSSVKQRSLEFTFSKVEGRQTVFTIRAAQATQFSGDNQSRLEDVDIIIYGEHGERHDEIHTRSCVYVPSTGGIVCHGKVLLDLSSAPVPGQPGQTAARIHIEARAVGFNRDTGEATSDAPVDFRFPEGEGRAVGVRYSSRKAELTLDRDVQLTLTPQRPGGLPTGVSAQGGLDYDRDSGRLLLRGPVEISRGGRTLETASLTIDLDAQMRPRRAVAEGRATVGIAQGKRSGSFEADRVEIGFDSQGRAETIDAGGNVVGNQQAPAVMRLAAQKLSIALDPADEQPRTVDATGAVRLSAKSGNGWGRLETEALHLTAVPVATAATGTPRGDSATRATAKAEAVRLDRAKTDGPATVVWQSGEENLRLDARRLAAEFDARSRIRELRGSAGVRLERRQGGETPVVTEAEALVAHFVAGEWSEAEETGHVRAAQGNRTASGERARWTRAGDALELAGDARIADPAGQTLADDIVWNQQSGRLRASGHVRSTYFANAGGETGVAPSAGPANVFAAKLVANPAAGEATYSGGARLWQGDLAIQARRIELRRASGELVAEGSVLGAFPQAAHEIGKAGRAKASAPKAAGGLVLWRVRAKRLTYVNAAGRGAKPARKGTQGEAVLEGGVEAWSSEGKIDAEKVVLTLGRGRGGRAELTQATASGGVKIWQGKRWGEAERAVYAATAGKFVLTGGHPSLHDTAGDLVRGDELTFYVADDTILVESSKGSRTLTRHPVPN